MYVLQVSEINPSVFELLRHCFRLKSQFLCLRILGGGRAIPSNSYFFFKTKLNRVCLGKCSPVALLKKSLSEVIFKLFHVIYVNIRYRERKNALAC